MIAAAGSPFSRGMLYSRGKVPLVRCRQCPYVTGRVRGGAPPDGGRQSGTHVAHAAAYGPGFPIVMHDDRGLDSPRARRDLPDTRVLSPGMPMHDNLPMRCFPLTDGCGR